VPATNKPKPWSPLPGFDDWGRENFRAAANDPRWWRLQARALMRAADLLLPHVEDESRRASEPERGGLSAAMMLDIPASPDA
jgi:hypothetical protein